MRTDIFLSSPTRRIIINTKYYRDALQERFGSKSFRSENLYQLFSYVKNAEAISPEFAAVEGMLLYPAVNHRVDAQYQIQGHAVRFVTIDLDQEWPAIEEGLRSLLLPPPAAAAA